ncbi:MAG: serine hydrolase [Gammaproteobacteria bacterium]|nr:serine hydrolase [Gammaproteobacteria bacterium]
MKKALIVTGVVVIVAYLGLRLMGLSVTDLRPNFEVATGMGAKLGCSGRYITGLSEQQVIDDVVSYSETFQALTIQYDDEKQQVSVSLGGLSSTHAQYRPGLGCTLEIGDTSALNRIVIPEFNDATAADLATAWPAGALVTTIDSSLENLTQNMLQQDNEQGLVTRALLIVQDNKIVAEAYADGFSPQTPLMGWSMGKSFVSILLGYLEHQGLLDVTRSNLFPEWAQDERKNITIENMLHMSSGLDFDETYAPGSDATKMLFTVHSASAVAKSSALIQPPGTHFSYSSGTTNLLSELFVNRLGGTQAAVNTLYNDIFGPLGMRHSVFEPDPSGIFVGSSYIYLSTRDWARLGALMLNNGQLNGRRFISESWVARATQPNTSNNEPNYGYQFWLNSGGDSLRWPQLPADSYAMSGNRHQTVMIVPSRGAVVIRLGWSPAGYPMEENFNQLLDALQH